MSIGGYENTSRVVMATPAGMVKVERQPFVKTDWYPTGVLTLIAGRAGEGKSTLALADVAAGTQGVLDGDYQGKQLTVAITAPEDSKPMQVARLKAAGANLERVYFLDVASVVDGETLETKPVIPNDLPQIRERLREIGATLWVIDPLTALIGGDTNRRDDVRAALDPLHVTARDLGIAIVGVLHFGKGGGYASDKISGSHAFRDVARSVLLVAHDDDTDEHVITVDKSNYSNAAGKSWSFHLLDAAVTASDGTEVHVPRVSDMTETTTTVGEIINRDTSTSEDGSDAESWLRAFLLDEDRAGSAPAREIIDAATRDGFSKATIQRVGQKLCTKESGGFQGKWTWTLKDQGSHQGSQGSHVLKHENYENYGRPGENYVTPSGSNVVSLHPADEHGGKLNCSTHGRIVDPVTHVCPKCWVIAHPGEAMP